MAERNEARAVQLGSSMFDGYVQGVTANSGSGSAAEIEKAKGLLDSGAITQAEFDSPQAEGACLTASETPSPGPFRRDAA